MIREAPPQPNPPTVESTAVGETAFPSPRQMVVLLFCYFAFQVILRVSFSSSVDLDESEQVVLGQKLCLGYGSDPPLYTWIQAPFFQVLGESVLALSLLKNLLLFANCLLTYAAARKVVRNSRAAVAAALSLFFIPSVAWESQRDLTHTVLSATLAVATLLCFLHLLERRRLGDYLLFGGCLGLGILTKYNYAFWPLGLVLAAASLPELRPAVADKRLLVFLGVAVLVCLPNGLWALHHRDLALLTAHKFEIQQSSSWSQVVRLGIKNILQSLLSFAAPISLIYLLVFLRPVRAPIQPWASTLTYRKLLARAWGIILLALVGLVMGARATGFKERWFQPILICLPIFMVALVQSRLGALRLRILAWLSLAVMLVVALVMPGRLLVAEHFKREEPLTRPYAQLAAQIRPLIPVDSLVVCNTRLLAGNLRLGLQQARVISPELTPIFNVPHAHCYLVWEPERRNSPPEAQIPAALTAWIADYAANQPTAAGARFFTAPYRYHKAKQYGLGFVQLY